MHCRGLKVCVQEAQLNLWYHSPPGRFPDTEPEVTQALPSMAPKKSPLTKPNLENSENRPHPHPRVPL